MDTFYSLNKLLSKLPFSILGYYYHEKEIDNFFEELCESDFISKKYNIELVSYSYAKLDNLSEWGTKNLSSKFFFHALNGKYSLLTLNAYYTLRNKLFDREEEEIKNSPHLSNNVAIVLSRLFLKDVGFRLSFTTKNSWHFSFLEQNNIFSIKLPLSRIFVKNESANLNYLALFRQSLSIYLSEAIASIDSAEKMSCLIVQKIPNSKSSYKKIAKDESPISSAFEKFKHLFKPKHELETLRDEFVKAILFWHKTNPGYFTETDTKNHIENWVELFFQIVFISLVFDAWIEYFPSVCGLDESNKDREYRNLGGLILGYSIDAPINQEERSIFRVISSRISSTVAGQWMFENNKELRRERNKRLLRKAFDEFEKLDSAVLHGEKPVNDAFKLSFENFFNNYGKILTIEFKNSYESLLNNNNNHCSKYCLKELKNDFTPCEKCKVSIKQPLFSDSTGEIKCCNENKLVSKYFNIPLIKSLMQSLTVHKNGKAAKLEKSFAGQELSLIITYENEDVFDVTQFIKKLKTGHNGSFIGKFFCDYYDTLDCHGIFTMEYFKDEHLVEFFNSRKSIKFVKCEDKTIEIDENYQFPIGDQLISNKIKITFKNEL